MEVTALDIPDLFLFAPVRHEDERGWFSEVFRQDRMRAEIGDIRFVQHNLSSSKVKGTVRGLHFQLNPRAQGKLVRCARGRVLDVVVDLRASSAHYRRHASVELSADTGRQLWIPPGFAHGFCTLEDGCELSYMVTDYYSPEHDRGLRWDDPALAIDWPVTADAAILSARDRALPSLAELGVVFA